MEAVKLLPPSFTGKLGVYCTYPRECRSRVEDYVVFLHENGLHLSYEENTQALAACKSLLVFLAPDADLTRVRQDITYALDRRKYVVCILLGEITLDKGLDIQLGLAPKISDGDTAPEQTLSALSAADKHEGSPPKKRILLPIAALLATVILSLIFFAGQKSAPETQDSAEQHIPMETALRDGLIQNGLDLSGDGGISKEELACAQILDLSSLGITDISPLAAATEITSLDLSNNNITDITALAGMKKLKSVNLSGNAIEDFQVLEYLPELTEQDISDQ